MQTLIQISHAFLDVFAGGRSNTKVYMFFLYFAALILLMLFVKKFNKNISQKSRKYFILVLILGHLLGVFAFYNFSHQYGADLNDFILTFNNSEVSSSQLSHNHVLKGSVGVVLEKLGTGDYENVDAGLPFVGLVPNMILWAGVIFICLSLILSLLFFASTISSKNSKIKKWLFLIGFSLAAFSLIKATADGGLLLSNSLPILAALLYGIYEGKKGIRYCGVTVFIYFIWTVIAWKYFFFEENYQLTSHLISGIIPFFILLTIFSLEKHSYKRVTYLIGVLFIISALFYPMYKELDEVNSYRNFSALDGTVALYRPALEDLGVEKSQLGNLTFYDVEKAISVGDLINEYNLLDNIYPIAVPWKTCIPTTFGDEYSFSLNVKSDTEINLIGAEKLTQFNKSKITFIEEENGISKYDVSVIIKPCLPRHLNIIQEYLKLQFKEPIFVYNIEKL